MESGEELTLPGKSFMEAISHVIYAAAEKEPSKPMLEGIYLEGCDGYINLVATDGTMSSRGTELRLMALQI